MKADNPFLTRARVCAAWLIVAALLGGGFGLPLRPPLDSPRDLLVAATPNFGVVLAAGSEIEKPAPRTHWLRPRAFATPDGGESTRLVEESFLQAGRALPVSPPKERDPPAI